MTTDLFSLPADHPGHFDEAYRRRRAAIAAVADAYDGTGEIPDVTYAPEEDAVWRVVSTELGRRHRRDATPAYLAASQCLHLPTDRVPQLREVDAALHSLTGWHLRPVAGLVPTRTFYGSLADRVFLSTQYIRHHSVPYYTPEPDIVHEIIGHANMLASPAYAELYRLAGEASRRAIDDDALERFSRIFWFTMEFGVCVVDGDRKAFGAGLLSSFGELEHYRRAELRPFDPDEMATLPYDITAYQPILFDLGPPTELVERLGATFRDFEATR
ncbi:MAG TPA: phenylalanine 4-monooxygenase, partial [Microthrixaceae bacterium]|nr:phenylalanine 4-monooxygenase [Microthrixaceae bacterium]